MKIEFQGTMPERARGSDAGYDLRANVDGPVVIPGGEQAVVPLGTRLAIPHGFAGFVIPRSGLAAKHRITVTNTPGCVDPGFRGEIMVILHNTGKLPFTVNHGDRIAQLVIVKVEHPTFTEANDLGFTDRGVNGFGSSGVE